MIRLWADAVAVWGLAAVHLSGFGVVERRKLELRHPSVEIQNRKSSAHYYRERVRKHVQVFLVLGDLEKFKSEV